MSALVLRDGTTTSATPKGGSPELTRYHAGDAPHMLGWCDASAQKSECMRPPLPNGAASRTHAQTRRASHTYAMNAEDEPHIGDGVLPPLPRSAPQETPIHPICTRWAWFPGKPHVNNNSKTPPTPPRVEPPEHIEHNWFPIPRIQKELLFLYDSSWESGNLGRFRAHNFGLQRAGCRSGQELWGNGKAQPPLSGIDDF